MNDLPVISPVDYFQDRSIEEVLLAGALLKPRRKIAGAFLYEDTTTLLFSRTNYGKSILAFQFAYAAATGTDLDRCDALCNDCEPMKVLVIDLELESRDIWERHGAVLSNKNPYLSNLRYLHEKVDNQVVIGYPSLDKIEAAAIRHKAKLVIIDNISKLLPDALKPDSASMLITMLNSIRKKTGCSIFVIGHTTKGNPMVCVQPTDYYGSSMLQNFFHELSYLDRTKDGNYFLAHSKTKHRDSFSQTVPVFSRGDHQYHGLGFTFLNLQNINDIQLPFALQEPNKGRHRNLGDFKTEISILQSSGISDRQIAKFIGVTHPAILYAMNNP